MRWVLGSVFAAYPFAVYYFVDEVSPVLFALVLGGLLLARVLLLRNVQAELVWLLVAATVAFTALAAADRDLLILKFYPVVLNVLLGSVCAYTLIKPPSAIQRLVQRLGREVPGPAVLYMRRLTCVWLLFFIVNSAVTVYTATIASTAAWAVYNGAVVYVLIGLLVVLEFPVRVIYKRRHREELHEALSER